MELFGLGGGFYKIDKVSFVFLCLQVCHSWIKYEACDLQAHPYTPAVLVRVGRSPVRCSLMKPNNLED
jgi:hypothetical protein